jgi:surface-anchored protein
MARTAVATTLAAALVAAVSAPAQAAPIVLTSGHVDVIDVDYAAGALTVNVLDGTGGTAVERNPADVILQVPAAAKVTVPSGSAWSFLGTGGQAWVLPQSQNPSLLWAGWNTAEVPAGVLQGDSVQFNLTSVTGPAGFSIYTVSLGTPTVLFDSGNGLPDTRTVSYQSHAHANWGFDAAGTYQVTFEVTGNLASTGARISSGAKTFTFEVLP